MLDHTALTSARERLDDASHALHQLSNLTVVELGGEDQVRVRVNALRGQLVKLDADLHRFVTGR